MNALTRNVTVILLVLGVVGCNQPTPSDSHLSSQETLLEDRAIPVRLPPLARVELKSKQSKSGRLTKIDPVAQQITLRLGNDSANFALADVGQISFQGELELQGKKIVIRGPKKDKPSDDNLEVWNVPLTDLRLLDANSGEAQLKLEKVPDAKFQGIRSVAVDSTYVVEELRFESPETLTVRAVPH